MRLLLVRHAEAAPGEPDAERPLTARGRADAAALGRRWREDGIVLDALLTSPLRRARQTGAELARETGVAAEADLRLAPGAGPDDVRAAAAGRGETVAVVGHQPDCGIVAAAFGYVPPPPFAPAGWVAIELPS